MRLLIICTMAPLFGTSPQPVQTGKATASGQCSVAHSGNGDTITIKNCGIGDKQGSQIIELLQKLLANPDAVSIANKLDEIQKTLDRQTDLISKSAAKVEPSPSVPRLQASPQTVRQTGNPDMPWLTSFTVVATGLIQTGDLTLHCDGPVILAGISRINPMQLNTGSNGPASDDPNTVVYQLGPETLGQGKVVTIGVYSKKPVKIMSGSLGYQNIVF